MGPSDSKPVVSSDSDVPEVTPLRTNDGDDETKTVIDDNLPIKLTSSDEKEFTVPYKTVSVFAYDCERTLSDADHLCMYHAVSQT